MNLEHSCQCTHDGALQEINSSKEFFELITSDWFNALALNYVGQTG